MKTFSALLILILISNSCCKQKVILSNTNKIEYKRFEPQLKDVWIYQRQPFIIAPILDTVILSVISTYKIGDTAYFKIANIKDTISNMVIENIGELSIYDATWSFKNYAKYFSYWPNFILNNKLKLLDSFVMPNFISNEAYCHFLSYEKLDTVLGNVYSNVYNFSQYTKKSELEFFDCTFSTNSDVGITEQNIHIETNNGLVKSNILKLIAFKRT